MRTYSHAILSYAATHLAKRGSPKKAALAAALGATLPDIPIALGAAWLWTRRKSFSRSDFDEEICGRSLFRTPDAALHSALPLAAAIALETVASPLAHPRKDDPADRLPVEECLPTAEDGLAERPYEDSEESGIPADIVSAFLLGWAGHVLADFLTHGKDARPILWSISEWKFESPVSYRERERHGRIFTLIEHAAVFATAILLFTESYNPAKKADG